MLDFMYFYLLRSHEQRKDGGWEYAQQLASSSSPSAEPSITCIPEYAKRCLKYVDVLKFIEFIKNKDNFVNKRKWDIVKYKMKSETVSWGTSEKLVDDYVDFFDNKIDVLSDKDKEDLENYKTKLWQK